jgi:hypothetical protein
VLGCLAGRGLQKAGEMDDASKGCGPAPVDAGAPGVAPVDQPCANAEEISGGGLSLAMDG